MFTNKASGRTYRVYRQNGQLHHQGSVDFARWEVNRPGGFAGSLSDRLRATCASYAVEVDGFLNQSPLAWYEDKKKWDMSPGYDIANHGSFERPSRIGMHGLPLPAALRK